MFSNLLVVSWLLSALSLGWAGPLIPQQDINTALVKAEGLYYEARFRDSIQLLLPLDVQLQQQPNRVQDAIRVKLLLAVAHIGINENAEAKARFNELVALDSGYSLDPMQYAPKVLALLDEAKSERDKTACQAICTEGSRLVKTANAATMLQFIERAPKGCGCVTDTTKATSELVYKEALDAYRRADFADAARKLQVALKLDPGHELATQYAELAEGKLRLEADRIFLDWRQSFEARDFSRATAVYQQMVTANAEGRMTAALDQSRVEYRKGVSALVESWKRECSRSGTASTIDSVRKQAAEMLPDQTISADLLATIVPCAAPLDTPRQVIASTPPVSPGIPVSGPSSTVTKPQEPAKPPVKPIEQASNEAVKTPISPPISEPPPTPQPVPSAPQACLQLDGQLAMTRVKTQVAPQIPSYAMPPDDVVSFVVKLRIDESGAVTVHSVESQYRLLNELFKTSMEKWQFFPAMVNSERRCVETEMPISLRVRLPRN